MPIYEYKCQECGRIFSLLIRTDAQSQEPHCKHCDSIELKRLVSRPGLVRTKSSAEAGQLRAVDPRRAVENMSRTYDQTGIDPGQGFEEVAKRAAAGDSPHELKEAVKEARKKETKTAPKSAD
ncbi:MAG TPA: zinc ribbon domain-containing protein [Anaerolineae bacterium]